MSRRTPAPGRTARYLVPAAVPDTLAFTATTLDGTAFAAAGPAGKPVVLWRRGPGIARPPPARQSFSGPG